MATRREVLQGFAAGSISLLPGGALAGNPGPQKSSHLGAIRAVTFTAPDLGVVESAWTHFMGYRLIGRGRLPRSAAVSWGLPGLQGRRYLILGPASGEPTCIRFIEQPSGQPQSFPRRTGWTAAELTVQNSDELYSRLKNSPFHVTRPPRTVPTYSYLRAMHAVGPAGEQLNLTWITEPRPDLAAAKSFVGRCFIAILGAPDLSAALGFYRRTFGNVPSPVRQLPGLQLSVIPLADGSKIEVDNAAGLAHGQAAAPDELPSGLAMVSFEYPDLGHLRDRLISHPAGNAIEPFQGKPSGIMRGPAGELIELLET
jgi:hypothetical protein